jgi:hypothetical protein
VEKNTNFECKHIDTRREDVLRDVADKEERKRQKRLRKEAEKAVKKLKRHKEKTEKRKARDNDASISNPPDECISSPSQKEAPGPLTPTIPDDTPLVRREKKKKKRPKAALIDDELDARPPVSTDERTRKDSLNFSRKKRRRGQSP